MKRHAGTSLLSAALLALALPVAGFAQAPGENFFINWDTDSDGKVTLEEVLERRGDLFTTFDFDEDGFLSAEELTNHDAMRDAMQAAQERPDMAMRGQQGRFGGGYGRGPGVARQGQMMPAPGWGGQPQGYGYGVPHPGWSQAPQGWGQGAAQPGWDGAPGWGYGPPQGMMQPGWNGQPMPPHGGMAGPQAMQQQVGGTLDADGDGQISRDEFVNTGEAWLARFDRNRDGVVNAQDFPATATR
ncbi:hypothetical protein [Maritimibacter sp. HL-12]|jgi:hypothetical protein|uniref:hypothetical protein n=1 Tax=Maritimibacter sp. HL-12 TaxID=1162418 RepID=UPI000A0EFD5F|nr:hypothetical protein [Maritimibacter sp. HL-12]SMH36919.1 EF hand [Maritimibacter sp. HL-12]